ncbi:MAG: type II toxin-antitoxin system RelE/ParE family toxin [Novosphingobium sp.]
MAEVRLTAAAIADLAEIGEYGAHTFGDETADSYQRTLDRVFTRLETFPNSGEARPEYGEGIRCVVHRSHRILYLVQGESVVVARILHHSRDVPRHLES